MKSPISGTIWVVLAYMIARFFIYRSVKVDTMWAWYYGETPIWAWYSRDMLMTIPRLVTFGALIWLARLWKTTPFDWKFREYRKALSMCIGILVPWSLYLMGSVGDRWPREMVIAALFTTPAVGLFEEYAFRGPLLAEICKHRSRFVAVIYSSLCFTLYHAQAQQISSWASIFLAGVVLANMRLRGLSLFWLALIHTVVDVSYFFVPMEVPGPASVYGFLQLFGLLIYAIAIFPYREIEPPAASPVENGSPSPS